LRGPLSDGVMKCEAEEWGRDMSSTDAEKARLVLDVFKHFDTEPGELLAAGNLLSIAAMNGWQTTDVAEGYAHGVSLGWFEDGPNGTVLLTPEGFAQL